MAVLPELPPAPAAALITLQSQLLEARSRNELAYIIANEPQAMLRAQQIVVLVRGQQGRLKVRAVSSLAHIDRSSPAVMWFESMVEALEREFGLGADCGFKSTTFAGGYQGFGNSYPLGQLMWVPWLDRKGQVFAGILIVRSVPFTASDAALARHLAGQFSQAWRAMTAPGWSGHGIFKLSRRAKIGCAVAAVLALLCPVPMTALAPVETAPRASVIVTAGVEGVIKSVLVEPNQTVAPGQPLVRLVDTNHRNRYEIAEREVGVAAMKYKKASQLAFTDARGRHELGIAQAELELKTSERDYALDLLARTEIKAGARASRFSATRRISLANRSPLGSG